MAFIFGQIIATISIGAAIWHLNQQASHFWDFVAFVCVLGGTIAVAVMTFPWQYKKQIASLLGSLFKNNQKGEGNVIVECMEFIRSMQAGQGRFEGNTSTLSGSTLGDGAELLSLGFSKEKVHEILEERIHQGFERSQKITNSIRSLAKYPPAFGLAGTVLGLVTLMRNVSEGADAKQTGLMMAIALMATFYGLLTANLLVNPAGEFLAKNALAERKKAEIALHAVLLYSQGASLLEAQEVLNSYVTHEHRVNVIGQAMAEAA